MKRSIGFSFLVLGTSACINTTPTPIQTYTLNGRYCEEYYNANTNQLTKICCDQANTCSINGYVYQPNPVVESLHNMEWELKEIHRLETIEQWHEEVGDDEND